VEVKQLKKEYYASAGILKKSVNRAVNGVNLELRRGETFGIVGESGCGKSTLAKLMMCLEKPTSGEVYFDGQRIDNLSESRLRALRPKFQMVFQDSGSSLNPRKRIFDILSEPMMHHKRLTRVQAEKRVDELLEMVALQPQMKERYPHELSGGQRQRVCIARALSLEPEVIVLDEPVSALDVSVQAQILNLLRDLQQKLGLTYLFIGHGLGAVHYISHRIAVMYMGSVVEIGQSDELFMNPLHPYTKALLDAAPIADVSLRGRQRIALRGEAGGRAPSEGCPFADRCPQAREACRTIKISLERADDTGDRLCACPYARKER
jgi:oligopeptide/dipeptide ABC transporter ATP-binding protein